MPKLPAISGKELVRVLEKLGFILVRQSGSHVLMEHDDGRITTVPLHGKKDIPTGTLRAILRDSDISPDILRDTL